MKKQFAFILALLVAVAFACSSAIAATKVGTFGIPVSGTAPLEVDSDGTLTINDDLTIASGSSLTLGSTTSMTMPFEISSGQTVDVEATDSGRIFMTTSAATFILPTAAAGLNYTFTAGAAVDMIIEPDNTLDYILYSTGGTMLDGQDGIKSDGQAGDSITLTGVSASQWAISGMSTLWSDNG